MVTKRLLTDTQREEMRVFIDNGGKMSQSIRTLRSFCNKTDLDEIEVDLELLRELKALEVKMGRPSQVAGSFNIRPKP